MTTIQTSTKWITFWFYEQGRVKIDPNSLTSSGDFSCVEANEILQRLTSEGWTLVACIDKRHALDRIQGMDLYFRKEMLERRS